MVPEKGTAGSMPRVSPDGVAVDKPKNRMLKCPSNLIFCESETRFTRSALSGRRLSREVCVTIERLRRFNSWICLEKLVWSRCRS